MGNSRSYALQTIWSTTDIEEFIKLFDIKTSVPLEKLGPRIDVPRGVNFKWWLQRELDRAQSDDADETIPKGIECSVKGMPLGWAFKEVDPIFSAIPSFCTVEWKNTYPETVEAVQEILPQIGLEGCNILCRGTTRSMTKRNVAEFVPVVASPEAGDLGPGFYAVSEEGLELAIAYAGPRGVLWIFLAPDYNNLSTMTIEEEEWTSIAARGHGIEYEKDAASEFNHLFDVLTGLVSADAGPAALQNIPPVQCIWYDQACFRSPKSFEVLADNLCALIYFVEPECATEPDVL